MYAIRVSDAAEWVTDGPSTRALKVLLSPAEQPVSRLAIGVMTLLPGNSSGLHQHAVTEEAWYIISGCGQVRIGDEVEAVEPGMVVLGPPGISHGFVNNGTQPLQALWIISPPGDEQPILDGLAAQQGSRS